MNNKESLSEYFSSLKQLLKMSNYTQKNRERQQPLVIETCYQKNCISCNQQRIQEKNILITT